MEALEVPTELRDAVSPDIESVTEELELGGSERRKPEHNACLLACLRACLRECAARKTKVDSRNPGKIRPPERRPDLSLRPHFRCQFLSASGIVHVTKHLHVPPNSPWLDLRGGWVAFFSTTTKKTPSRNHLYNLQAGLTLSTCHVSFHIAHSFRYSLLFRPCLRETTLLASFL